MWIDVKDMENVIFLCFFVSVLVPFGADGQSTGSINIQNCTVGSLDIRVNENNTIVCNAFGANTTIAWFIRKGSTGKQEIATCGPFNCTVKLPTYYAALRFPEESHLFYQQHDVSGDFSAQLSCKTQQEDNARSVFCNFNVINPATLSDCVVEEDRRNGTVTGSCRFRNALSHKRGLACTWYQENTKKSRTSYKGVITVTSTKDGGHEGGQCTLSSNGHTWDKAPYSYSVDFYPGNGRHAVHTVEQVNGSTGLTFSTTKGNEGSLPVTTLTSNLGTGETGTSTTDTADTSTSPGGKIIGPSRQTPEDSDVPVAAIAGGIVAAVAVIIVIVVVLIVVFRKHRRQKPTRSVHGSDTSKENDDFEEHVHPMYVTSEDPDDTHSTDHKPSAIALRISSSTKNGKPDPPNSLEADHYSTVDGEVDNNVNSATNDIGDGFGGYEDIVFGSNQNAQGRRADEHAVVDKSRANKGSASAAIVSASPAHTTEGSGEYAVVDKSSSRNKVTQNVSPGLPTSDANNAGTDVYAQVNKSAKTDKAFEPETEGAAYAQVQKPKPAAKPAQLSPKTDVAQRGATDDDEYHTLSHTRGSPHTQRHADLESQYSHIGHVGSV